MALTEGALAGKRHLSSSSRSRVSGDAPSLVPSARSRRKRKCQAQLPKNLDVPLYRQKGLKWQQCETIFNFQMSGSLDCWASPQGGDVLRARPEEVRIQVRRERLHTMRRRMKMVHAALLSADCKAALQKGVEYLRIASSQRDEGIGYLPCGQTSSNCGLSLWKWSKESGWSGGWSGSPALRSPLLHTHRHPFHRIDRAERLGSSLSLWAKAMKHHPNNAPEIGKVIERR